MGNWPKLRATSEELLHLDLLRFIASAGIVVYHAHRPLTEYPDLALFVDLFFAISGFVIAYVYSEPIRLPGGYLRFLQRRVGRLVPLHWLTLFAVGGFYGALSLANISVNNPPSTSPACVADAFFLLHGVIPCGNEIFLNAPSWSISAEFVMYLAFPLFALAARWRGWLPGILAIAILTGIAASAFGKGTRFDLSAVSPVVRALPSFLFGITLFQYRNDAAKLPSSGLGVIISAAASTVAMLVKAPGLLSVGLLYLTLVLAVAADTKAPGRLVARLAPWGQLTYSIYMWHWLIILIMINGIGDKLLHGARLPMIALTACCYATILGVSYLSFFYVETPARRWIDGLGRTPSTPRPVEI